MPKKILQHKGCRYGFSPQTLIWNRNIGYNYEYDGYVFVDELGEWMRPEYLTSCFPQYIQKHGLKRMRFPDLRHSCASLPLANSVPLKQIPKWLERLDFSATANIYTRLDYTPKRAISAANRLKLRTTTGRAVLWVRIEGKSKKTALFSPKNRLFFP